MTTTPEPAVKKQRRPRKTFAEQLAKAGLQSPLVKPDAPEALMSLATGPEEQEAILKRVRESQENSGASGLVESPVLPDGPVRHVIVGVDIPVIPVVELTPEQARLAELEQGVQFIYNLSRGFGGNITITRRCEQLLRKPTGTALPPEKA